MVTKKELQMQLKEMGLKTSGNKQELVVRIEEYLMQRRNEFKRKVRMFNR